MVPETLEERTRQWSVLQPWLQEDPITYWNQMRDSVPIVRSEEFGGYWILTRFEDIEWAARNPDIFSSAQLGIPHRELFESKQIPIQLDGEVHRKWRRALADIFSPSTVDHFTPQIRLAAKQAVMGIAAQGHCEFVSQFAVPLPARTFLITFGVGEDHLQRLLDHKNWLRRSGIPNARSDEDIFAPSRPLWAYFSGEIDKRRAEGTDGRRDVISNLLNATYDGREITQDEMVNAVVMMMLASLDTTASMLALIFHYLAGHPEIQDLVVRSPEKIPVVVEELLRHQPLVTTGRLVVKDVERHGVRLRAGDRVLMSWGMTGRDPAAFARPDEVDLDGSARRHLAFGAGPHRCLGLHLARRIITVALEEWHAHIPRYQVTPGTSPVYHYLPVRGLTNLQLTCPSPPA